MSNFRIGRIYILLSQVHVQLRQRQHQNEKSPLLRQLVRPDAARQSTNLPWYSAATRRLKVKVLNREFGDPAVVLSGPLWSHS